jgi:hypothetical protein
MRRKREGPVYEREQAFPAWLSALGVGDEVAVSHDSRDYSLARVVRVTPAQIVVKQDGPLGAELKYWRADGLQVGSESDWLVPVTDEIRETVRVRAAQKVRAVGFAATPEEQRFIKRICRVLKQTKSSLFRNALRAYVSGDPDLDPPRGVFEVKKQGQRS